MAGERVPEDAWIHSFKCARCRLEFMLLSGRPDRHTVFNVSCPACGNAGAFLHFRSETSHDRSRAWPSRDSIRMFDSILYSVDGGATDPADRVDPVELSYELSELSPEPSLDAAAQEGRRPSPPTRRALGQILVSNGHLSPSELDRALELHRQSGRSLGRELLARGLIDEPDLVRALAEQLGLEYVDLSEVRPDPTVTAMLSRTLAERYRAIPIAARDGELLVAMSDPTNMFALEDIRTITGCEVRPVVSTATDIEAAIGWLSPSILSSPSRPSPPPGPPAPHSVDELQRAVEEGELRLHYLPIVDLTTTRIWGVEALIRWQHPTRGLLGPVDFLPLAEETGQIVALGTWVLHQACHEGLRLQEASGRQLDISVNVSTRQLERPDLVEQVVRALGATGLQPRSLILEITETARITDMDQAVMTMQELKALGVRLAVDNFGCGYSSLEYVQRFPIDILKIHGSFIDSVTGGGDSATLSAAVIELAGILNFQRVAVGIERADQVQLLRQLGCDAAEGEYFGRPIPVDAMADLLRAKSSDAP